ncbi:TetR/AcrR family transcriptional regulator [Speluncibacter jeojiensis]|uniref:TetR/AcrR family transcriptional regulator n=1 Tax=Speluncibacter jeojiensis TaxID=2710754 RepID=A0A9X4LZN9_9ACTN|nr:TetR/AcrR family transcriptional regulator [Corynebacteriales bacterium D3-21]
MAATPRSDRRAQILGVAVEMLQTASFEDLAIDRVAAAAGVSQPLLFHYFKNKAGFQHAVLEASATAVIEALVPGGDAPAPGQLRDGVEAFVDVVLAHPTMYRAVMRLAASGDEDMRRIYRGTRMAFTDRILETLGGLGVAPTPALSAAVTGWQAFVEEVTLSWVDSAGVDDSGMTTDAMTRDELLDLCERAFYQLLFAANAETLAAAADPAAG